MTRGMRYQTLTTAQYRELFESASQDHSSTPWRWIGEGLLFIGALAPLVLILAI